MRFLAFLGILALMLYALYKLEVPMLYIFYILFLGVPVLALAKIASVDLSEYNTDAWTPRKIKKKH
ncbi:MAG TPA: hypothetical protein PK718_07475 [Candidatus Methanofastidiosa archaeon]|nr:hypothetical protein [Candidatus Methanofastidiosa archaeon]